MVGAVTGRCRRRPHHSPGCRVPRCRSWSVWRRETDYDANFESDHATTNSGQVVLGADPLTDSDGGDATLAITTDLLDAQDYDVSAWVSGAGLARRSAYPSTATGIRPRGAGWDIGAHEFGALRTAPDDPPLRLWLGVPE